MQLYFFKSEDKNRLLAGEKHNQQQRRQQQQKQLICGDLLSIQGGISSKEHDF